MKLKVGNEPQRGSKKRKAVGNDNSLVSNVPHVCKCDVGMSVENVSTAVNIKKLKGPFIPLKFSTGCGGLWVGVEKKKSVVHQFAIKYKSETYY